METINQNDSIDQLKEKIKNLELALEIYKKALEAMTNIVLFRVVNVEDKKQLRHLLLEELEK